MHEVIEQSAFITELNYKPHISFNWKKIKIKKPKKKLNQTKAKT